MALAKKIFTALLTLFIIMDVSAHLCAQDLPNKQENSLYAPVNVKIDGNTDEWGNKFQAYNTAVDCYYTMANSGENLYIAIHSKDIKVSGKIISGGITVNFDPRKNGNRGASITYGAVPASARVRLTGIRGAATRSNTALNVAEINKEVAYGGKEIDIKNLDSIPDTRLSIYNEYNITAAAHYNDSVTYTYELCIPLKHIKSFFNNASAINYTIQINGQDMNGNDNAVKVNGVMQETLTPETKALINSLILAKKP